MNLRLALYALVEQHGLDDATAAELDRLAGIGSEPAAAPARALRAVGVIAALLVGLGVVMWVAANWNELGRFGRLALLQGFVALTLVGAWARPSARAPLGLLAFLGIGGLLASFGQAYQTGADPWSLFALWALLALPLALAVGHEAIWLPWTLVAFTGITLWIHTYSGHRWQVETELLWVHGLGWSLAGALVVALAGPLRQHAGAARWSQRTALSLAVAMVTLAAIGGLAGERIAPHYPLGLLALAALIGYRGRPRRFDLFAVSAAALGLDVLIVGGLARLLLDGSGPGEPIGRLLLLGLAAAALLAATVSLILALSRRGADRGLTR